MAITFVQGKGDWTTPGVSTHGVTLTAAVGSGNMLCVTMGGARGTIDTVTVTDDKGNTYTGPVDTGAQGGYQWQTFYCLNITNAPQTITWTDHTGNISFSGILVDEFSGVATSAALDGHNINSQGNAATSADAVTSNTVTPSVSGDLIYSSVVQVDGGTPSHGTNYNDATPNVSGVFWSEYQVYNSISPIAGTWTASSGTNDYVTAVMAFKAAAAGGAAPPWGFAASFGPDDLPRQSTITY